MLLPNIFSTGFKALTDRIRIQISYPNGQRIGFSFVTLTIQIDVPKSEQIRIIARPIRSDANTLYLNIRWSGAEEEQPFFPPKFNSPRGRFVLYFRQKTVDGV